MLRSVRTMLLLLLFVCVGSCVCCQRKWTVIYMRCMCVLAAYCHRASPQRYIMTTTKITTAENNYRMNMFQEIRCNVFMAQYLCVVWCVCPVRCSVVHAYLHGARCSVNQRWNISHARNILCLLSASSLQLAHTHPHTDRNISPMVAFHLLHNPV